MKAAVLWPAMESGHGEHSLLGDAGGRDPLRLVVARLAYACNEKRYLNVIFRATKAVTVCVRSYFTAGSQTKDQIFATRDYSELLEQQLLQWLQ